MLQHSGIPARGKEPEKDHEEEIDKPKERALN